MDNENAIRATLTLAAAANREWDILVIGAGPAGSMAALRCAKLGARVLLVDGARFPRPKVCGCCINSAALGILERHNIELSRYGAIPLNAMTLAAGSSAAEIELSGMALSRNRLDALLIEHAIDAGAHFLPEHHVRCESVVAIEVSASGSGAREKLRAKIVLGAGGLGCRIGAIPMQRVAGSRVGAGARIEACSGQFLPGRIYMSCAEGGYVGLVRIEDGRLNAAAALDHSFVRRCGGVAAAAQNILDASEAIPRVSVSHAQWHGTALLTQRPKAVAAERIFLIGDNSGYVEPFTGEGIAWGLAAGEAIAPLALECATVWRPSAVEEWSRELRRIIGMRQIVCRNVCTLLRQARVTRAAVKVLGRVPTAARPLVSWLNAPITR